MNPRRTEPARIEFTVSVAARELCENTFAIPGRIKGGFICLTTGEQPVGVGASPSDVTRN
ncbi:MAG: hypothetical protein ACOYMN_26255 [Roseimicrobium sp.]